MQATPGGVTAQQGSLCSFLVSQFTNHHRRNNILLAMEATSLVQRLPDMVSQFRVRTTSVPSFKLPCQPSRLHFSAITNLGHCPSYSWPNRLYKLVAPT